MSEAKSDSTVLLGTNRLIFDHAEIYLEFKLPDFWIGTFWKRKNEWRIDIWICFIPCLPVHIIWWK